jgi:hypothetical protein
MGFAADNELDNKMSPAIAIVNSESVLLVSL